MVDALPQTMRAAYVERLGAPEEIQVGAIVAPLPRPTDVLVAGELAGQISDIRP